VKYLSYFGFRLHNMFVRNNPASNFALKDRMEHVKEMKPNTL